uniref:Uncharacterized protein n=1 Tax=Romanomermis culicivorax TaxID=13658 RepID=A0A915K1X5_ROMCU
MASDLHITFLTIFGIIASGVMNAALNRRRFSSSLAADESSRTTPDSLPTTILMTIMKAGGTTKNADGDRLSGRYRPKRCCCGGCGGSKGKSPKPCSCG